MHISLTEQVPVAYYLLSSTESVRLDYSAGHLHTASPVSADFQSFVQVKWTALFHRSATGD